MYDAWAAFIIHPPPPPLLPSLPPPLISRQLSWLCMCARACLCTQNVCVYVCARIRRALLFLTDHSRSPGTIRGSEWGPASAWPHKWGAPRQFRPKKYCSYDQNYCSLDHPLVGGVSSVSQCCRELRFIETKPKILNKKGFVLSVTNASIFACPNRAPIPGCRRRWRAKKV